MEKYSDYTIVHEREAAGLAEQVNQLLKDGWILLGAPFSHKENDHNELCQAMIKPDSSRPGSIGFNR